MADEQHVEQLVRQLQSLADAGIENDALQLKRDMVRQFVEPRLWVREYVVNAYDAGATTCHVSGHEDDATVTIIVEDDGWGMDRDTVTNWGYLFRSIKGSQTGLPQVGQFGIGKLSPAAMPQIGFSMITSTGEECWRFTTGCLLDDSVIRIERITPVSARGTKFEITFEKEHSVEEELRKLHDILHRFVRYLPMTTVIHLAGEQEEGRIQPHVIRSEWCAHQGHFGATFSFALAHQEYEVLLGIGRGHCELYQKRVLVSDDYDLLNMVPESKSLTLPHVALRVDAPRLALVLGRHRAADEKVLQHLSEHLKNVIVPRYVTTVVQSYRDGSLPDYGVSMIDAEEIAIAMMDWDPDTTRPWSNLAVFAVLNGRERPRFSLKELVQAAQTNEAVYLAGDNAGTDFSLFDAPVLSSQQPAGALAVLRRSLGSRLTNLAAQNVVIEAPANVRPAVGEREERFESMLRFDPEAIRQSHRGGKGASRNPGREPASLTGQDLEWAASVCEEARQSCADLECMSWRVGWLVQPDGQTPSRCHRYRARDKHTVVLNLYHPEMERLLRLSESDPALAGHWALASCLCDGQASILPHLTMEAREDLLLLDCMAKAHMSPGDLHSSKADARPASTEESWLDFIRNADDPDFGLV